LGLLFWWRRRGDGATVNAGRPVPDPARLDPTLERELIIGRGARGYVALYRYVVALDTVFLLAIRGQLEGGYRRG
jgi:hypothetical protein